MSGGEARGFEAFPASVRHGAAEGDSIAQYYPAVGRRAGVSARHRWEIRRKTPRHEIKIHYNETPNDVAPVTHGVSVQKWNVEEDRLPGNRFNYSLEIEVTGFCALSVF